MRLVLFIVHYPNKEPFMQSKCFYTLSLHMHGSACRNCTQIKSKIEIDYSISMQVDQVIFKESPPIFVRGSYQP